MSRSPRDFFHKYIFVGKVFFCVYRSISNMNNQSIYKIEICHSCNGCPNPVNGSTHCDECFDPKTVRSTGIVLIQGDPIQEATDYGE